MKHVLEYNVGIANLCSALFGAVRYNAGTYWTNCKYVELLSIRKSMYEAVKELSPC
jgi:hypothetical protein